MRDVPLATAPTNNAVVHAAAGTGKTWLLTHRIVRLLLAGAAPGAILAITFTRKAAGEIRQRVTELLLAMAAADDPALSAQLAQLGVPPEPHALDKARGLYETVVSAVHELRATTFHAFCQEILRRFPLEAEVPPGFELIESTSELETQAWHNLDGEITRKPAGEPAQAMDILLKHCGGPGNTRDALSDFLAHRSDWWAYTEGRTDPIGFATAELQKTLAVSLQDDPLAAFQSDPKLCKSLDRYTRLLAGHSTQTNLKRIDMLTRACSPETTKEEAFSLVSEAFLTKEIKPRVLKTSQVLINKLGAKGADELQQLHQTIIERVLETRDRYMKRIALETSRAWWICGQRLLHYYQGLKAEQKLLDFADLEWQTYRLLSRSRHIEWVQYKLDQRIDHLLVDEFQDTNPTQWRLLLPLMEEMAAGDPGRQRSVFLVGDEKQSIYRFRRADPKLFHTAREWLTTHTQARTFTQHISWRSSRAIIQFVNLVFDIQGSADAETPAASDYSLPNFHTHDTQHKELWGLAELLPLIPKESNSKAATVNTLRNPLEQPRVIGEDERHRQEGELIAAKIQELIGQPVSSKDGVHALNYGDIMILVRDRNYVASYEDALRRAGIPYLGAARGTFLECLEIRDLIYLLKILIAPYDDLALASVLRSPIFAAMDEDLMHLALVPGELSWYERLLQTRAGESPDHPLARACRLLQRWSEYADRIPVHDLLDRIYSEGNILARYSSAAPPHLKPRVEANLNRFLSQALEVDSGRYPSLARFLARLDVLANENRNVPSETLPTEQQRVSILTIHGAKGLEKPVVFLVDAARKTTQRDRGARALIEWPVEDARPRHFYLTGKKETLDEVSRSLQREQEKAAWREEANLLYVALTRAKQILYISGCEPGSGDRGWYGFIEKRLRAAENSGKTADYSLHLRHIPRADGAEIFNTCGRIEHGSRPPPMPVTAANDTAPVAIDAALSRPLSVTESGGMINPSRLVPEDDRPEEAVPSVDSYIGSKKRGIAIHRMLELLTSPADRSTAEARAQQAFAGAASHDWFEACWQEACRVVDHPKFRRFFDPSQYGQARNEVPILYGQGEKNVYGIVDRLLVGETEAVLIDYKTHAQATHGNVSQLAEDYTAQMQLYSDGIRMLWPSKKLKAILLFTACCETVEIPLT